MGHNLGNNYGKFYSFLSKPVWVDCNFLVTPTNGLGITSLKGQGVENVFMHTSTTPTAGPNGYLNPNPPAGYALVQLAYNYNRYCGGFKGTTCPLTGSNVPIDASDAALTVHNPYVITAVGAGPKGAATIAPVADVAGNLASKYFSLYDNYGNTFIIWFSVSGVGTAPAVSGTRVKQSIATGDTAATIGAALVTTIAALPSGVSGIFSFTAAGTTTVTVTSTANTPLPGAPADGISPLNTGFTFATTVSDTNLQDWQAVGVPKGVVPAVGVSFIATATGAGASTGTVKAPGTSGISAIEVIGDPNLSFAPIPMGGSPNSGGWILLQFLAPSFTGESYTPAGTNSAPALTMNSYTPAGTNNSSTPPIFTGTPAVLTGTVAAPTFTGTAHTLTGTMTLVPTAPATGSLVSLGFYVEEASLLVAGE